MTKHFPLSDILTVTTDMVLSPNISGAHELLEFMLDTPLGVHEIPEAGARCREPLLQQLPQLATVDASQVTPETWRIWMLKQTSRFGATLPVTPL